MEYKIGMILEGKVTGIQPYGVFVALDKHTQGLIHVSEVQHGFVKDIHELMQVGEEVEVEIIDIDEYTQKISLSLRSLSDQIVQHPTHRKIYFTDRHKNIGFRTLEEEMPRWLEEATENLKT